ncbi:hypothetical protein GC096_02155 [Paenibacillus sp. LMG 31461]|uniref:Tat pathway signal sequence domain protein n=1 Tax=Paenibacillus plantarum TaxID=2654975 RepID=A0ABX1X373_9BACL|nr:hypothetical protein [Paenibacillus plantarum]NOU62850.1 hypothetical protein [Paenibacillus plantarum]
MSEFNLHWLTPRKASEAAVSFGTPWVRGGLLPGESIRLLDEAGNVKPVQTKINAYWPDGTVKWLLHSAVLDTTQGHRMSKGEGAPATKSLIASQNLDGTVTVESELLSCTMATGNELISSITRKTEGQSHLSAQLIAFIENRDEQEDAETVTIHKLIGVTKRITLEESGPLRAVVKAEGTHSYIKDGMQRFPFTIRLYFYAGSDEVRIVHSFIYDGDENIDFLKGLAVQFHMQAGGELWNRHVGFTGDTGMFYEAVQPIYIGKDVHPLYEKQQVDGQFITIDPVKDEKLLEHARDNAYWGSFQLQQDSCEHYSVVKRTKPGCAYIPAVQGNRSKGAVFFGCERTIVAVGIKDFWQKCPMSLEVTGAADDQPVLTVWLRSKNAEAYDFRAYDTVSHQYSYGDLDNHPQGIANTNEMVVKLFDCMPGKKAILNFAEDVQTDALLITDVSVYEQTNVFGTYWCQPKEERYRTEGNEQAVLGFIDFYRQEIEQRKWYGFWDYGDVMHTYDPVRHCWLYDVGGYAWQNTELCNTYVNWLAFLRTGDYEIYRFARAMTRHTSEVDTYHLGKYAMLGSRHNVRHWGCKWKEVRISMAGHHRFFYYLTGDERIGDIMDFVKDSDLARRDDQIEDELGRIQARTGPDWSSFVSNWMTRWERFQDTVYRDKILTGIRSLKNAPNRLSSGSHFLYNSQTSEMGYIGEGTYQYHMVVCFGAPEIWFELVELIEDEEFKDMLAQFGNYYAMTPEERQEASYGLFNESNDHAWRGERFAIRMFAYAGYWYRNAGRMQQALEMLSQAADSSSNTPGHFDGSGKPVFTIVANTEYVRSIREVKYVNTNGISQWSLNYIETARLREMIGEQQ